MDRSIVLREWKRREAGAEGGEALVGLGFDDPAVKSAAEALAKGDRLRVQETRHGLAIEAQDHVGVVQVGPLRVTVLPKIPTADLWAILIYGLGLDLDLDADRSSIALPPEATFADVLGLLLVEQANALLRRGLRRAYRAREDWLAAPRGRLQVSALAAAWPLTEAALPCAWHGLSSDTLDNQVVRAGLRLARRAALLPEVRGQIRRAERAWEDRCREVDLDAALLARVERERTRLTAAYEPAHRLVALLWSGAGLPDELDALTTGTTPIPGFLWNMATLFERFVARFLREHVQTGKVDAQVRLGELYRVVKSPRRMRAPTPRPDLTLSRGGRVVLVMDTKYVDLLERRVPDEILYQLSVYGLVYASAEAGAPVPVVALYPASRGGAEDVVIELCPPGRAAIPIRMRAVDWVEASRAMGKGGAGAREIAEMWVRVG